MAFPFPPDNAQPIPNSPFYFPETAYLYGPSGPLIVGSGFSINNVTGTINVSGGGSGAPTILAGAGISVVSGVGTVTIANTGIRTVTAGAGISVSVAGGNLNIVNTAPSPPPSTLGTVTSVTAGTGLTGGVITTSGTIALDTVGSVSPGTYNNATITVDAYGRVTYAAPGSGTGSAIYATAPLAVTPTFPQTISIQAASTATSGAVQLNTSTASTSTTQAATPSAVKQAYDLGSTAAANAATALSTATGASAAASSAQATANTAQATATAAQGAATAAQGTATAAATSATAAQATANAAIPCSSFTTKGQLLAATGPSTFTALPAGTNGQVLIACSSCTSGLTWISQPVAAGTVTSVGTGPGLLGGPITTTGTITLAPTGVTPNTYTYANVSVDAYGRVTAAGCGVPPIPCSVITGKGVVLTGTAANSPTALPAGTNGYVLTACSACATGLTWALAATSGIPCSAITGKGALITGTAANVVSTLPVGSDNFVLTADSACASGLKWAAAASPTVPATPTTEGVIYGYADSATNFATALGYDALNTTVTGPGNVAIGTSAGCSLAAGQLNTYVGSGAGCANTTGCNNIALGAQALFAHVSGDCNIVIGNLAGLNLTTESGNVILGPYQAEAGCDNNVYIADGTGALRLRLNEDGALALGGSGYGTSGQVLTSAGPGSNPTWVASSGGSVTSITAGTGLTGGTITTAGTINLANTTVTAGSYTNASITVDVQGRLTAASSGLAPLTALTGTSPIAVTAGTTPTVSIASSSTTAPGAVQLYDNVDSTSTTLALTAAQGKNLQDQITALAVNPSITLAGTINADTGGIVESVTSAGSLAGYVVGNTLPAADATTADTYVIVTTPGTMTPPGGSPTAATRGDWFLVSETSPGVYAWTFLNVGFDVSYATTSSSGVVCLATNAQAQAGTNTLTALTPAAAASAYIPKTCVTAKGTIITGDAPNNPVSLPVGTDGQALVACAACPTGLFWTTPAVPVSPATPTVSGTVLGCTLAASTALGCNALLSNTGAGNSALGVNALSSGATGNNNTAIGACALCSNTTGVNNTAIGSKALILTTTGNFNVAIGRDAMVANTTGCCNTVLGYCGACNLTTGSFNVAIGTSVQVASGTGSCQLAIGFSATDNWLTGDSSKNIQPGAGIKDCAASTGTAGQILSSTATGIAWRSGCVQQTASCTAAVTLSTEITTRKLNNGDSLTVYNSNAAVPPVAITLTATAFTNYQTYPTQSTATVFTLPPKGSVTLILADSATNTWYVESYDTPAQVGTVAFKVYNPNGTVPTLGPSVVTPGMTWSTVVFPASGVIYNDNGYYNNTTTRFQPLVAGYYHVIGRISVTAPAFNQVGIVKNGNETVAYNINENNNPATETSTVVYLNGTTDYIQLGTAWASAGTFRSVSGGNEFSASLINQTNTRVVGIDAVAGFEVTAGTIPSSPGILPVIPGTNGVVISTDYNPQSWLNTSNGRITPTIPGYYQVDVVVTSNSSSRNTWGGFLKNGVAYGQSISTISGSTGDWNSAVYSAVVFLNGVTDYVQMGAGFQGSTTGFGTAAGVNRISVSLVGANVALPPTSIVGQSVSGICNAGVALCMDNLKIAMSTNAGARSLAVGTVNGTAFSLIQTAYCQNTNFETGRYCCNLTTALANINGWSFLSNGAVQSATVCMGTPPTAAYCISMMVGCGYSNNILCITRIV